LTARTPPLYKRGLTPGGGHRRGGVMSIAADPRRCFPSHPLVDDDSEAVVAFAVNDLVLLRLPCGRVTPGH
jgi:hypothetical protein